VTRRDINLTFNKTQPVQIDSDILRKNKVISHFHKNGMANQVGILCAQVLKGMEELGGNSLLVTSANQGEGKTFVAINLAVSISQELDRMVLLVDTNLRAPSIHRYFGLDDISGLSDHLMNQTDIADLLINASPQNLAILPAGKPLTNFPEVFGAPKIELLVKEIKERYPECFIIFDSSALLNSADPLVFSWLVDGVLLVVEGERTLKCDLLHAIELLKDRGIVGTILNKTRG
jgi:non-specific protein-tyrosine kinase